MLRLFYISLISSLLFALGLAGLSVPLGDPKPGVYTPSFGELFLFPLLYVAPLYITLGTLVAYVTTKFSEKMTWRFPNMILGGVLIAALSYVIGEWNSVKNSDTLASFVAFGAFATLLFFILQLIAERWVWKERAVANDRERGGLLFLIFSLFIGALYAIVVQDSKGRLTDEAYAFLSKEGCYYVVYNQPDAPPLPFEDGWITYDFTKENPIITSSPQDLGWEGKNSSGAYRTHIVVDGTLLPLEEQGDLIGANGSTEIDGRVIEHSFMTFDSENMVCEEPDWSEFQ
ncbi:hypothetical protein IRY55_03310 [Savagea sp. SN6]|uniref:Uncharacterized protein n=1 Tax=Savagea serpentis TaxID=2785297 RepID=A0A8J7G3B5_9BACL|nr:hypothetical protein [Savagea serpentis]MBF4500382.1 hypothetical protein [Savagea serpentis]